MTERVRYLRSLRAIRESCASVFAGPLEYFTYDAGAEAGVVDYCAAIIARDWGTAYGAIPPHGRMRHLDAGRARVGPLMEAYADAGVGRVEAARRLVDLVVVSVLLDAGAGGEWVYEDEDGATYGRSEGLGVASVAMFRAGGFSGGQGGVVSAQALAALTVAQLAAAFQVRPGNAMAGLDGRVGLLVKLGHTLEGNAYFPGARPGGLVDYLLPHVHQGEGGGGELELDLAVLWDALVVGLGPIWPSRTHVDGVALGDVWPHPHPHPHGADKWVAFHKLTQWLCYSLVEALHVALGITVRPASPHDAQTGLPEYRNGGLLIDLGVLTPTPALPPTPLPAAHPAIVEWRASTVILLDRIAAQLRTRLGADLSLAQILEAATWKGGREIAREKRSDGSPPINIVSDGTVF